MGQDYLRRILTAKVYDVAVKTPLMAAVQLSHRYQAPIWLKREELQPVFSFKLRGAYNKMAHLNPAQRQTGVIAASAGNHAQGVALAAQRLHCRAVIVMPVTTPQLKIEAVKRFGGEWVQVVLHGESYSDAAEHALSLEAEQNLTFVHPFDDPDVIAGQGTIGMEILQQHSGPIEAIFVAIGGGGLAAGVATYIKHVRPGIRVIGVQTLDSHAMQTSLEKNQRVRLKDVGLFSDGTAVKQVGKETLRLCREYLDDILLVSTDEVCAAVKDVHQETRGILEPAGALALAGLKRYVSEQPQAERRAAALRADADVSQWPQHDGEAGGALISVTCGANMNFDRLRFIAERAEVGEYREALFAVSIPEERGSFLRFCDLVGERNVTEFNYRIADEHTAHIFVGLQIQHPQEPTQILAQFKRNGFEALNLTHDELAKQHLRHMIGGQNQLAAQERIFRFEFPERPGALRAFLLSMKPAWNISLFNYRNHGSDVGKILVGIQTPAGAKTELKRFLNALDYPYQDETDNPAYQLFLGGGIP